MVFSSSPVLYPRSSSPAAPPTAAGRKRKLFQTWTPEETPKKARMLGGFILDDDEEEEEEKEEGEDPHHSLTGKSERQVRAASPGIETGLGPQAQQPKQDNPGVEGVAATLNAARPPQPPPPANEPTQTAQQNTVPLKTSSGKIFNIRRRSKPPPVSLEATIAQRSTSAPGRARTSYYGVDIHKLLDEHKRIQVQTAIAREQSSSSSSSRKVEAPIESVETEAKYYIDNPVGHHRGKGSKTRTKTSKKSIGIQTNNKHQMWTEKYRPRRFTDLIGDHETHQSILLWLKSWDPIVFPGSTKPSIVKKQMQQKQQQQQQQQRGPFATTHPSPSLNHSENDEWHQRRRKVLLLTGPPGLGKTTIAHICARQVGYEVLEINASDERSRDVVRGRIRDVVGTENVRGIEVVKGDRKVRKAGRPVCVVVDEVDGVTVSGSGGGGGGGGEGGFMKALVELIQLDQRNTQQAVSNSSSSSSSSSSYKSSSSSFGVHALKKTTQKKKGDRFRFLRPLILVCNDVYAPALRPLRASSCAEIIHVRPPHLERTIGRLRAIFDNEGIASDGDAVRRLCEASWGGGSAAGGNRAIGGHRVGAGEGDIRAVLVQAEWVAHKLLSSSSSSSSPPSKGHAKIARLTKAWLEDNIFASDADSYARGLSRGGVREILDRIFIQGAGLGNDLPTTLSTEDERLLSECETENPVGVYDVRKRVAIDSIRQCADTLGEHDRLMTDCFSSYPSRDYQDDSYLTKPAAAYDWLHFHDLLSSRVFRGQEWDLNPYLSQGACAFHYLFATAVRPRMGWDLDHHHHHTGGAEHDLEPHPFAGPRADFAAFEAERANRAVLSEFQSNLSAPLARLYRSSETVAMELVPSVARMLAPNVKPVVVGGGGSASHGGGGVASVRKETEKRCVGIASRVMGALKITFDRVRVEIEGAGARSHGGFAFRMEPSLDSLATFESIKPNGSTGGGGPPGPVRYAVRQILDQEHRKEALRLESESRLARGTGHKQIRAKGGEADEDKENRNGGGKKQGAAGRAITGRRDFFGRILNEATPGSVRRGPQHAASKAMTKAEEKVWVSFHEGFSNAVRKPITLKEFLDSF